MASTLDLPTQLPIVCPGHSRPLTEVFFSEETPDGVFLMSGCHAKTPMLRRGDTGDWVGTFEGHKGAVWGVAMDKSAQIAATASGDFSARIWNAITGKMVYEFPHKHVVKSVDFSDDATTLATGGHEGIVRFFRVKEPSLDPVMINISAEKTTINKVRWSIEPHILLSGSTDGVVRMWDVRDLSLANEVKLDGPVMDMEVSRTTNLITIAAGDKVTFLNALTLEKVKEQCMPINFRNEGGASLHPSGKRFVAGGNDLWVRMFDFETGNEIQCMKGHHGPIRCIRYHRSGSTFASGSEDGTIRIWTDVNGF